MNKKQNIVLTGTIILGILSLYIMQMGPSSILVQIKRGLAIESEVMLNMVVNIVFCFIVLGCIIGPHLEKSLEQKISVHRFAYILGSRGIQPYFCRKQL